MAYGLKLPGTDIVKVPNSGGGADPTKLPLSGGNLSGLLGFTGTTHAGIRLNSLTTTQRDALTAGAGDFILNTTLNKLQGYISGNWVSIATLGANIFTGQQIISTNGAASTPPLLLNGTIFTGGTGTTNLPNFLVQPTGATAATAWSTSGTAIGVNLDAAAGNFAHFMVDGSSKLTININGTIELPSYGSFLALGGYLRGGNIYINNIANVIEMYNDSCAIFIGAGTATADLRRGGAYCLQLGTDAAGVSNQHFKACNRITSDGVGANLTISGGNGRGGAGGDLILASYTTAGSGVAGTLTPRWRIDAATGKLLPEANATYDLGGDTLNLSSVWSSAFYVGSDQVVGPRGAAVTDASGGAIVDDEARTAINDLLARVRAHGLIAP